MIYEKKRQVDQSFYLYFNKYRYGWDKTDAFAGTVIVPIKLDVLQKMCVS